VKHYGYVIALKDASIEVKEGEIRALLGGNGSGKSTLAKAIGGIIKRNSGVIEIDGKEVNFNSPEEAKKHHVIVASQELSLFPNLTVAENIMACSLPVKRGFSLDKSLMKTKTLEVLKRLNLGEILDSPMKRLAPNQKYMVEFAKTLVQNPRILILDEITSPLYREDVQIVKKVLHELKREGCMIIFISHRMHEIFDICDTVTVMKDGVSITDKNINETSATELLSLMTGLSVEELNIRNRIDKYSSGNKEGDEREVLLSLQKMKLANFGTEIDLLVRKGDFVGIAGLQGHGQSDLIRQIYGLQSNSGFEYKNAKFTSRSPRHSAKNRMAFISGDRTGEGIYPVRSVAENVKSVANLITKEKIKDPGDVLDRFGVKYNNQPKNFITSLSGGNQQKVVVARWLTTDPELLLTDDPTKGIDVQARYDMHHTFIELAKKGSGVVMVSSDDEELVEICKMTPNSRVLIMYEGEIVKELTGEAITAENILAYSFA
jgi:ABC-type sugar transport system ATPase subunit